MLGIGNKVFDKEYLKGGVEVSLDQSNDPELVDLACASFLLKHDVNAFCPAVMFNSLHKREAQHYNHEAG